MATQTKKRPQEAPPEEIPENGDGKKPAYVASYYVGKDTYIQASVWSREVQNGDSSFVVYDVSLRKRTKVGDEWKSFYAFRGSELPFVSRAIDRAETFILEQRKQDIPF
jgi:hypothetical protein